MSSEAEKTSPKYRIGIVSRLTGISAHQLRVWERRYKTVAPARSEGGDRLYSDSDVARLRMLKKLSDLGHSIGRVAHLGEQELTQLLAVHPPEPKGVDASLLAHRVADQFLDCVARMDLLEAERRLSRASVAFEPNVFVSEVLLPSMRAVGRRWARGEFSIAQEHGASAVLRTQLGALMRLYTPDVGARVVVSATPSGELHEFGALAAALTAASRGWKVVYLGPNLPVLEVVSAVRSSGAELVLISAVISQPGLHSELIELRRLLPGEVRMVIGGAAAISLTDPPVGLEILDDIEALDEVL